MIQLAPRIVVDERVRFGKPVIEGTRVPVDVVLGRLAAGMTTEAVAEEYGLARYRRWHGSWSMKTSRDPSRRCSPPEDFPQRTSVTVDFAVSLTRTFLATRWLTASPS
jgi:hypothetical protein